MRTLKLAILTLAAPMAVSGQDTKIPAGWEFQRLYQAVDRPDTAVQVWVSEPGWEVRTTEAGLWWDPRWEWRKNYVVEVVTHIAPSSADGGFGVFVGGRDLQTDKPFYLSFQVSREERYVVENREGPDVRVIVPWLPLHTVNPPYGAESAENTLRLEVRGLRLDFYVNGIKAITLGRSMTRPEGMVGLRLAAGLDMHITSFTIEPL